MTVQAADGRVRPISGTMELRVDGEHYTTVFDLETIYPQTPDDVPARVRGRGRGMQIGDRLAGITSSTLQIQSEDPGAEEAASELRVVSTAVSVIRPDGALEIYLQNEPQPGQEYSPSITLLNAQRIGDLIDVAGPPPSP